MHGVFVFALFGGREYENAIDGLWTFGALSRSMSQEGLALAIAALAASHLFSFVRNYLLGGEFRNATLDN